MNDNKVKKYFYTIKYPENEENLCYMEMKYLFNKVNKEKEFFSDIYINPSRSPFLKFVLEIIYMEDSLDKLIDNIKRDNISFEKFKVIFIRRDKNEVSYEERLKSIRGIGSSINGVGCIHNEDITLGVTKLNGKWIFGIYEKSDPSWQRHDEKPYSYSNALSTRVARSLINIAVKRDLTLKVIDPCCGVGTVVIEGVSMGIDIKGYEINPQIAYNGKRNMEALGYPISIVKGDMMDIDDNFDVAIVDMPYGLFTKTTLEEQKNIINKTRKLAKEAIIITFENMDDILIESGFNIVDRSFVLKNSFKRYITICK